MHLGCFLFLPRYISAADIQNQITGRCFHFLTDGIVLTEDFVVIMRSKLGPDELTEEELREAFSQFDEDGSGAISPDELRQILSSSNLSEEQVDQLIIDADTDGDGEIDFDGKHRSSFTSRVFPQWRVIWKYLLYTMSACSRV